MYISPYLGAGLLLLAVIVGYFIRTRNENKLKRRIKDVETDLLRNHDQILQLQREKIELLRQLDNPGIPVISIAQGKDEQKTKKQGALVK